MAIASQAIAAFAGEPVASSKQVIAPPPPPAFFQGQRIRYRSVRDLCNRRG